MKWTNLLVNFSVVFKISHPWRQCFFKIFVEVQGERTINGSFVEIAVVKSTRMTFRSRLVKPKVLLKILLGFQQRFAFGRLRQIKERTYNMNKFKGYPPWNYCNSSPLKIGFLKRKVVFQPSIFLGAFAVSFREIISCHSVIHTYETIIL